MDIVAHLAAHSPGSSLAVSNRDFESSRGANARRHDLGLDRQPRLVLD